MDHIQFYKGVIDPTGCIGNGWNLVKEKYGLYFGVCFLGVLMISCIPCINFFILGPITGGIYYILLRDMRGEPIDFGMLFKGFEKFLPLMVVGLIQSIPAIISQIIQYTFDLGRLFATVGGDRSSEASAIAGALGIMSFVVAFIFLFIHIIWAILFWFAVPIVLENDIGPIDALKLSVKAASANVGTLILLGLLLILIMLGGTLALCIGLLFVLPVLYASNAFAYRQVFPSLMPNYENIPPTPDMYGGSFGRGM